MHDPLRWCKQIYLGRTSFPWWHVGKLPIRYPGNLPPLLQDSLGLDLSSWLCTTEVTPLNNSHWPAFKTGLFPGWDRSAGARWHPGCRFLRRGLPCLSSAQVNFELPDLSTKQMKKLFFLHWTWLVGHSFNIPSQAESASRMLQFSFLSHFTSMSIVFSWELSESHHTVPYWTRLDCIETTHAAQINCIARFIRNI